MQYTSLTADQLRTLATLKHAASKADITPIINGIHVTATERKLAAYSTDRYRCAEYTVPLVEDDALTTATPRTAFDAVVPPYLLDQVVKAIGRVSFPAATIAVEHDEAAHRITFSSTVGDPFTIGGATIVGNYPPLARLYPDPGVSLDAAGPVKINSAYLSALDKIRIAGVAVAHRSWELSIQPALEGTRSQPPVLYVTEENTARIRVLIQPKYQHR